VFTGLSLNLYSQIGIVLLIGLMAKNGILIVEFANQLRNEGRTIRQAVVKPALRLRPSDDGDRHRARAVPLVLASGAGAESRIAIGTVIVGGRCRHGADAVLHAGALSPARRVDVAGNETEKALEAELAAHGRTEPGPVEPLTRQRARRVTRLTGPAEFGKTGIP
jgi:multidrug efflux pump